MPVPIYADDIAARLKSFPRDNYLFMGSVMKGISLSVATAALFQILSDPTRNWPRLGAWVASLLALLVTHMTWGRGILVTNSRANAWDTILPLLMGMAEFLLYGVLIESKECPNIWLNWTFAFALHAYLAVLLVQNRIRNSIVAVDFEPGLRPLGLKMEEWIKKDRGGASFLTILSLVFAFGVRWRLVSHTMHSAELLQFFTSIILGLILLLVIRDANRQRRIIDNFITALTKFLETSKQKSPQLSMVQLQGFDAEEALKADKYSEPGKSRDLWIFYAFLVAGIIVAAILFHGLMVSAAGAGNEGAH